MIAKIKELVFDKDNLIASLFLITLFVTHFPNGISYHLITTCISIALWIVILADQQYRVELFRVFTNKTNKKIFGGIAIFLMFGGLSLFYSTNFMYGQYKLLGLLFDTFPAILVFYLILQRLSSRQLDFIISLFLLSGLVFTSILYYKTNLVYLGNQKILLNWSHVGFGKFLGYASLCALFYSVKQRTIVSFLLALFILSGLFLSGLRAPIIFVIFCCIVIGLSMFFHSSFSHKKITIALSSVIFLGATFIFINFYKPELERRFERSMTLDVSQSKDPSIKGRYTALRDVVEMVKEKPLSGWGLGGFNIIYNGSDHTKYLWYPHNMLAEIGVELGIPVLLYFLFCLIYLLYNIFKIHQLLGMFFSLALWNALFTGDISYQKVLFIGIAFLFLDRGEKENIAQLFKIE